MIASSEPIRAFFAKSSWLDQVVLRPLSHIAPYWELQWNDDLQKYQPEEESFAEDVNALIEVLAAILPPESYHDNEDVAVLEFLKRHKWPVVKRGRMWTGEKFDYAAALEHGSFQLAVQSELLQAASGRIHIAIKYKQHHFDEMDDAHFWMLGSLLTILLYQGYCSGNTFLHT